MVVTILGSGAWGSALANVLADNGHQVYLWSIDPQTVDEFNHDHTNRHYFDDIHFNASIMATLDLSIINSSDVILFAVPASAIHSVACQVHDVLEHDVICVNVAKGFDPDTHQRLSVVIEKTVGQHCHSVVALVGPSLAIEVAKRLLTSVAAVSDCMESAMVVQQLFSNDYFRVYTSRDIIGSEVGVAIKNILAIASGILTGLGQGDNARAALMTRGLAEMRRYGVAMGGEPETYFGLTGIGDLIVTCTSHSSRNFSAGYQIGQANSAKPFWDTNTKTVEGVKACKIVYEEACRRDITMPITSEVYKILYDGKKPSDAINDLMRRRLKSED